MLNSSLYSLIYNQFICPKLVVAEGRQVLYSTCRPNILILFINLYQRLNLIMLRYEAWWPLLISSVTHPPYPPFPVFNPPCLFRLKVHGIFFYVVAMVCHTIRWKYTNLNTAIFRRHHQKIFAFHSYTF